MIVKAFLLAAGLGTRLRPLTDHMPKCLVPIRGQPLLGWWFRLLERHGVQHVFINLHHLADRVHEFLDQYQGPLQITRSFEKVLLGSAGTLRANRTFVGSEYAFLICYADNLTNADLPALVRFHRERQSLFTMGLFRPDDPRRSGLVETDITGRVIRFQEKPTHPAGEYANAGIYVSHPSVLNLIPETVPSDISYHLLPQLVGAMYAQPITGYLRDIGTPDAYRRAQGEWTSDY